MRWRHHRQVLVVALVVLWCALACAFALLVGRSVGVADAEARAAADDAFALAMLTSTTAPDGGSNHGWRV